MSFAHLHSILRENVIFVLDVTFYADESGIHDPHGEQPGSEVAAIAGYIATKRQWKTFEQRWNTALKKFNVPEFHMSDFNRKEPKPPYVGWSDKKKRRFLHTLIRIARDNTLYGYASMVETKAWDTILDYGTKGGDPQFYNPYHICFQNFFAKFLRWLKNTFDPNVTKTRPVENIAFVFHRHQKLGPIAEVGFEVVKGILDTNDRLASITFGSAGKYVPLQAADLIAFYSRRIYTRHLKKIPMDEFELALQARDNLYLLYLSRENLKELQENSEKTRKERERA